MADTTQIIGLTAGVCTSASLLPQFVKLIKTKKADDISIIYLCLLFTGVALWIWYGIRKDDLPIISTNAFSLLLNAMIIFLGVKYKKQSGQLS